MHDLIIIGAGPAGLTAGIYAARAKLNFIILEQLYAGGKLIWIEKIENFPGCPEELSGQILAEKMYQQALRFGSRINFESVSKVDIENEGKILVTGKNSYETKTVIIASGSLPRKLDVPGEKELLGKGVSYCALCDGYFFRDKKVAVVGDGSTAFAEARFLTKFASVVWIKKGRDTLPGDAGITMMHGKVVSINGKDRVEGLTVEKFDSGKTEDVAVDGVFIFAGFSPSANFLPGPVEREKSGYVVTDGEYRTAVKGIYACGDIRAGSLKQVVNACAEGACAVEKIRRFLAAV